MHFYMAACVPERNCCFESAGSHHTLLALPPEAGFLEKCQTFREHNLRLD